MITENREFVQGARRFWRADQNEKTPSSAGEIRDSCTKWGQIRATLFAAGSSFWSCGSDGRRVISGISRGRRSM